MAYVWPIMGALNGHSTFSAKVAAQTWGARESTEPIIALPCSSPAPASTLYKNHPCSFSLALSSSVQDLAQGIILRTEAGTTRLSNTLNPEMMKGLGN